MGLRLTHDFETRSAADLPKIGAYRYSTDPSTEIICLAYTHHENRGLVRVWIAPEFAERYDITDGIYNNMDEVDADPVAEFIEAYFTTDLTEFNEWVSESETVEAHNAFFERCIYKNIMMPKYGSPAIPDEKLRCSAAKAATYSLPRSLEGAGAAMQLDVQKDMVGSKLLSRMMKPKPARQRKEGEGLYFESRAEVIRLALYCARDIITEELFSSKLPDLIPFEQRVWQCDQDANERGVYCDIEFVNHIVQMVDDTVHNLTVELYEITGGAVLSPGSRKALIAWVESQGYELENTQGPTLDEFLKRKDVDEVTLRGVKIVRLANRTSTKKFLAMQKRVNEDSRMRDLLMYHGANTGRWSGRGVQLHNLPRGIIGDMDAACDMIANKDIKGIQAEIDFEREILDSLPKDLAKELLVYTTARTDAMELFSSAVRGAICSPPGRDLVVADYSSIEARGSFWAAGDEEALGVFHQGKDIYCDMASTIFGRIITKADAKERQLGKQCLAADTQVLTSNGAKDIICVQPWDMLWDGEQWVSHQGLVCQGSKKTVNFQGLNLTPDHKIMVETGEMREVSQALDENLNLLKLGTSSAISLSLTLPSVFEGVLKTSYASANVEINLHLIRPIYSKGNQNLVQIVVDKKRAEKGMRNTEMLYQTKTIELVFLTDFLLQSADVTIPEIEFLSTTEVEEFLSIEGGEKTAELFFGMSRPSPDGIVSNLTWTELTITQDMNLAICDLSLAQTMPKTKEELKTCKKKSESSEPVFDIANAGPNHRFTVVLPDGGLCLVSNCILGLGYQMGANKFLQTCWGYNIFFDHDEMLPLVTNYEDIKKAILKLPQIYFKGDVNKDEHLDDIIIAKFIVDNYRKKYAKTVQFWNDCEEAAKAAIHDYKRDKARKKKYPNKKFPKRKWHKAGPVKYKVLGRFLLCQLPSGRRLAYPYPYLKMKQTPVGDYKLTIHYKGVDSMTKRWTTQTTYGGKLVENIIQAIARDLMANAMILVDDHPTYDMVLTVHDEIVSEADEGKGSVKEFEELISILPDWAEGYPLAAEGWRGKRYRK